MIINIDNITIPHPHLNEIIGYKYFIENIMSDIDAIDKFVVSLCSETRKWDSDSDVMLYKNAMNKRLVECQESKIIYDFVKKLDQKFQDSGYEVLFGRWMGEFKYVPKQV